MVENETGLSHCFVGLVETHKNPRINALRRICVVRLREEINDDAFYKLASQLRQTGLVERIDRSAVRGLARSAGAELTNIP